jgi:hypothetical protein
MRFAPDVDAAVAAELGPLEIGYRAAVIAESLQQLLARRDEAIAAVDCERVGIEPVPRYGEIGSRRSLGRLRISLSLLNGSPFLDPHRQGHPAVAGSTAESTEQ